MNEMFPDLVRHEVAQRFGDKAEVWMTAYEPDGVVTLEAIWSNVERKKGIGTSVLKLVCLLADQHNVDIKLSVSFLILSDDPNDTPEEQARIDKLNDQGMDSLQLQHWYEKHGFVLLEGSDPCDVIMCRKAQMPSNFEVEKIAPVEVTLRGMGM